MVKLNKLAAALVLSLGSAAFVAPVAQAAEKCPIDKRQSKAVGQSVGKKVQRSYKAYTEGNLDEALAILLEANPKNDFDKAYLARMLGNFYAEKQQFDKALTQLRLAVDADILGGADHAGTLRLLADLSVQEKKWSDAISMYKKWMAFTCKQDDKAYFRIAIAHSELKQWDKALAAANKGIELAAKPNKGLYQLKLTAYYNKKDYKNAVKVLETMVPLFQDDGKLWVQLAQFYLVEENYKKSLATFDLAYKNGFLTTAGNITRLSQLLASNGSPYRGAKIYEKHLKSGLIKKDAKTLKTLAGFYHTAKELKEAANYYGQSADISKDGQTYLRQARLLSLDGKESAAIKALNKSLKAGLKNPGEAHFELALAYLDLKQYKSAYNYAQKAMKDKKTKRSAKSYVAYIKEKARIHNVAL
ncbi:MAG: tetratricopeptide repeat protein [Parashewanella sp.]